MLIKLELDRLPRHGELGESLLHLILLGRTVDDLADIVDKLVELELC